MSNVKQFKIIKRGYGIADRFPGNIIYMNKHLDKFQKLKRAIIQHEVKHTNNVKFNKEDFVHDLATIDQFPQMQMIKFILLHPFSMVQFLPIYYTKRFGWIYDLNLIVLWSIALILLGVSVSWGLLV